MPGISCRDDAENLLRTGSADPTGGSVEKTVSRQTRGSDRNNVGAARICFGVISF